MALTDVGHLLAEPLLALSVVPPSVVPRMQGESVSASTRGDRLVADPLLGPSPASIADSPEARAPDAQQSARRCDATARSLDPRAMADALLRPVFDSPVGSISMRK